MHPDTSISRSRWAVGAYAVGTALLVILVWLLLPLLSSVEPVPREIVTARIRADFCQQGCQQRYQLFPRADQDACAQRCLAHQLTKENFADREGRCLQQCPDSDPEAADYLTSSDPCMEECLAAEMASIEEGWEVKPLERRAQAGDVMLADPMQRGE